MATAVSSSKTATACQPLCSLLHACTTSSICRPLSVSSSTAVFATTKMMANTGNCFRA
ncbi:hypothetical protein [Moraxella lacunata]|uniref:hypothetical protein n=1 Tax=Moraxella lacunata TaxID=477 RepID=UPI003EE387D0